MNQELKKFQSDRWNPEIVFFLWWISAIRQWSWSVVLQDLSVWNVPHIRSLRIGEEPMPKCSLEIVLPEHEDANMQWRESHSIDRDSKNPPGSIDRYFYWKIENNPVVQQHCIEPEMQWRLLKIAATNLQGSNALRPAWMPWIHYSMPEWQIPRRYNSLYGFSWYKKKGW